MLAAQCAWTILRAEHSQVRQRLASITEALCAVRPGRAGPEMTRLRQAIESLQAFDVESHRPKGIALTEALRGRSPDADRLLAALERQRERDDVLLVQVLGRLDAVAAGEEGAAVECAALLARYRERVLHHMDQEDTLLCAQSEQLLSGEEWSRVVSQISSALYSAPPGSIGDADDSDSSAP